MVEADGGLPSKEEQFLCRIFANPMACVLVVGLEPAIQSGNVEKLKTGMAYLARARGYCTAVRMRGNDVPCGNLARIGNERLKNFSVELNDE